MRILTLCYEYPPIGGGGGRVAQAVAEGLAARGHEVRVQTAGLGLYSGRELQGGVQIIRHASGRRRADTCRVHEMGLYVAASFLPTLSLCRRWKPEVLHAHFALPTGLLAWLLSRATGIPYVLTSHLGDVPGGVPAQTDRLFRLIGSLPARIWREAAAATAVSGYVQELAELAYDRPVVRILNGIDLSGRPAEETLRVATPRRLLFLGRFNPQKNTPFLIEALARVSADWRLTMIGDGPDTHAVRARIGGLGLRERVCLAGWQPAEAVAAALAESDVLCLPSSSEGLPVAAVEALKYGLAIAATNIPGVRDVVTHGENGLALPPAEYAAGLDALLQDEVTLLCARRASWRKAQQFELTQTVTAYERVLIASAHTRRHQRPSYSRPA